jgi:hypothetical protein
MAVVGTAVELVGAREKSTGDTGVRTYRRRFLVTTNNVKDDSNVVELALGIPQRYFPYVTSTSVDSEALVTDIQTSQQTGYHWHIDVTYSTDHGDEEEDDDVNPLARAAEIDWDFETVQIPIFGTPDQNIRDPEGNLYTGPIRTSAGEIFDPPANQEESRPVVTVTRNEATYNPALALQYHNAVNSDYFQGIQPRQAKMRAIRGTRQTEKGQAYWRLTYVIAFKFDLWDLRLLDHGSWYLDGGVKKYFEEEGVRYLGFLNTDGTARATSDIVAGTTEPNFLKYRVAREEPFSALNLPITR